MKATSFLIVIAITLSLPPAKAQVKYMTRKSALPSLTISDGISLHLVSPEPITYVDISTHGIAGDIPVPNVLRLKALTDTASADPVPDESVVTVIGQTFVAQYNVRYSDTPFGVNPVTMVDILPAHTRPLDIADQRVSEPAMRGFALRILSERAGKPILRAQDYGMRAYLNGVYTFGDHVFLDITYENGTNLQYDIDGQRFKIEDKRIVKATNAQSVEIEPVWQLYRVDGFRKRYRNIYAFKKVTFPGNKVLRIELSERQVSGRVITLELKYRDILEADSF